MNASTGLGHSETIRTFWHGGPLGPYRLVGLRSFVDRGHRVELFTYDPEIAVPDWLERRNANEIWPADRVLMYRRDLGRGSFALHANLFRYAMLHKLGGWWVDADVVLLRPELPKGQIFFALECEAPVRVTFSVLKLPSGHPALAEALDRCIEVGETVPYGETGPDLLSKMVVKYGLAECGSPMDSAYPLSALDVRALFDPQRCAALKQRCANATFVHLFNETWRRAGIPHYLGPPRGSFMEHLLLSHGVAVPDPRMEIADVKQWTAYLTLHDEYQRDLRAYRESNKALRARLASLESSVEHEVHASDDTDMAYQSDRTGSEIAKPYQGSIRVVERDMNDIHDIASLSSGKHLQSIEERLFRLERKSDLVVGLTRAGLYQGLRSRLRPHLWDPEQYSSRRIRIPRKYHLEQVPHDPPRIAIVTPSFNQGNLIAATIDSVLGQSYPNLGYFVQDGASRDNTRKVLESYGANVDWQSEPDAGQSEALNKGFEKVDGDIMAYINSDDILLPGTLAYVARAFIENPDVDVVYGHRVYINSHGFETGRCVLPPHDTEALNWADYIPQETLFWRGRVWKAIGPFDESFDFALDWDFILRAQAAGFTFRRLPRFLACFRLHDQQKNIHIGDVGEREMQRIRARHFVEPPGQYEIRRALLGYLLRQMFFERMYWLGVCRY
jgi:glycosyltransferase involved in cell wall biosynthesis